MKLKSLEIENFRNFEFANINLANQNVIFGMNDVGKTNFMYALRFLLDREIRKNGFRESDYYKNNTENEIKITLVVSLEDREFDDDSQHIIAKVGGSRATNNGEQDLFYFRVTGEYDKSEGVGITKLYWGNNIQELDELIQKGIYSPLDKLFKIVYVDPTIDLAETFAKNRKHFFDQTKLNESDITISKEIKDLSLTLNEKISSMEVIKKFQENLTSEYKKLKKENISIEMKSEISINGYFGNLIPYLKRENDDNIYPTSGDGRKKILAYSILNHIIQEQTGNQIIIYLIEEPENSLHRSMQIALSKQLFESAVYKYFFLSTHSSELLYELDNASLIRVFSKGKVNCESYVYCVEDKYKNVKKELNKSLSTALFAETVLLVEGPSEKVLFEKILEEIYPTYELDGGYLLDVGGINFEPYIKVLKALDIKPIIKTDNDLKAKRGNPTNFDLIGLNRCLGAMGLPKKESVILDYMVPDDLGELKKDENLKIELIFEEKKNIFAKYNNDIEELKKNNIFLSEIDLEHDLYECIGDRMTAILGENPIKYLQSHKLINMIELTNSLCKDDCKKILEHKHFEALGKLVPSDAN
ncbi:ATP-dependent nuclease [Bacillus massiliigorillae]|uniref:ATP-dependent nuclease n=1 Tax=Bacillus massiliigorillae TaxID=1243664 RepID=UPI0003A940FB|nr:AAA family ATPase [Bacillus massiliigorillae]